MKITINLLIALGLLFSCEKPAVYEGPCDNEIVESTSSYNDGPYDPSTKINSIVWNGECLEISVSYSGGCEEHAFEIVTDGSIIKTDPPIINLGINHSNTDLCQAYLTESISIGLGDNIFLNDEDEIILNFTNPIFTFTLEK